MTIQRWMHKMIIGGLLAGMLAFGGLYAWNAGQEIVGDSGEGTGSPKIATTGTGGQVIDRD